MDASVTQRKVNVMVSQANVVSFGGAGIDRHGHIHIDNGRGKITFRLGSDTASFPSAPIQWTVKEGQVFRPIEQPSAVTVRRVDATNAEIEISTQAAVEYSFFVIVQTPKGKFFGTDPTIVTMRPGSDMGT